MSVRYITRPLAGSSRYTAGIDYRGTKSHADVMTLVLARLGSPGPADPAAVVVAYTHVVIELVMDSWRVEGADDLLGFMLSVGGSQPAPDFAPTWENLNVAFTGHFGDAGDTLARGLFSAEKTGDQGRVVPVIVRATNMFTHQPDRYSPGKPMQIELENRRVKFDPAHGSKVTFRATGGTAVDVTEYAFVRGTVIAFNAPTGLTGPQELSITCTIGEALRTGVYPLPLAP